MSSETLVRMGIFALLFSLFILGFSFFILEETGPSLELKEGLIPIGIIALIISMALFYFARKF